MAGTPPEQPWTNHEKNYLLAEIIKTANLPANVLFEVLQRHNIQPRWEDIPLPPGRSLNSSRNAFEDLRRSLSMGAPIAPHTPTPLSAPFPTLKRPYTYEGGPYQQPGTSGAGGREIRPKLQPTSLPTLYVQPSPAEPPPKRKRGRPTKAEALKKAETAGASGQVGAPGPTSGSRPMAQVSPQLSQSTPATMVPTEEVKLALPPTTTMAIAAMLTPTAREPKSASNSHSSSSSGKRRQRARSTKSEHEDSPAVTRSSTSRQEYDSPYARSSGPQPDTPARAAVLRHREDPLGLPRSTPGSAPPTDPSEQPREYQ